MQTVQFPVTLPQDDQQRALCEQCAARFMEQRQGISAARIVRASDIATHPPVLELDYDTKQITLADIRPLIERSGCCLGNTLAQLVLPIEGLHSPHKQRAIDTALGKLPGVDATASYASQSVQVTFDRKSCAIADIVNVLEKHGVQLRQLTSKEPDAAPAGRLARYWNLATEHIELTTAILGAVMLVIATAIVVAGSPSPARYVFVGLAYVLCGWHTAIDTVKTLVRFRFDIDVLMFAAAIGAASLGHFEEGALLLLLFALGHAGEELAVGKAKRAIESLTRLAPATALRIETVDGQAVERDVPVGQIQVGDRIRILPDSQLPADGAIIAGNSTVDQSAMTGESVPIDKQPGDTVFAGTFNGPGSLVVEVTKQTADNTLSRLIRLVQEAQTTRSPTQQLTDRIEKFYVPLVLIGTALLIVAPPLLGLPSRRHPDSTWAGWFYQAMAFLTAASPCALAIGTPAAVLSAIGRSAKLGVLIKGGVHLENLGRVRAIAFDKTGTLTVGQPSLTDIVSLTNDHDANLILRLAGAVEQSSRHPLAVAIANEAGARHANLPEVTDLEQTPGVGIRGRIEGKLVSVSRITAMIDRIDDAGRAQIDELEQVGKTVVAVAMNDTPIGLIALSDQVRASSELMLQTLRDLDVEQTIMLTGDHEAAAYHVANKVGIGTVMAQLMPEEKLQAIDKLGERWGHVAMVGDGVNDAPAMARADVAIAVGGSEGGASETAMETADVVMLTDNMMRLPDAVGLSRFARSIISQNLLIAFGTIALLAPLAALGIAPIFIAVLFHEGSTVVVVLNALRLLGYKPPSDALTKRD